LSHTAAHSWSHAAHSGAAAHARPHVIAHAAHSALHAVATALEHLLALERAPFLLQTLLALLTLRARFGRQRPLQLLALTVAKILQFLSLLLHQLADFRAFFVCHSLPRRWLRRLRWCAASLREHG